MVISNSFLRPLGVIERRSGCFQGENIPFDYIQSNFYEYQLLNYKINQGITNLHSFQIKIDFYIFFNFPDKSHKFINVNFCKTEEYREPIIKFKQFDRSLLNMIQIYQIIKLFKLDQLTFKSFKIKFRPNYIQNVQINLENYPTLNYAKIVFIHNQIIKKYSMRRRFLRPFFDFHDPCFLPRFFEPTIRFTAKRIPIANVQDAKSIKSNDPHDVFERFFNQNGIKQNEKGFFKKHYPQKVQQQFDPYKVLEITKETSQQKIKEAYRNLALKYHPKNNSDPEAAAKFADIAKAYEEIMAIRRQGRFADFGFQSFFEDFDQKIGEIYKENQGQKNVSGEKFKQSPYGELYSESSHAQSLNGKQTKLVVEKTYKKDGKILSVRREEKLKEDGQTEITQTIDDGKEVKKKHYVQGKENTKKLE